MARSLNYPLSIHRGHVHMYTLNVMRLLSILSISKILVSFNQFIIELDFSQSKYCLLSRSNPYWQMISSTIYLFEVSKVIECHRTIFFLGLFLSLFSDHYSLRRTHMLGLWQSWSWGSNSLSRSRISPLAKPDLHFLSVIPACSGDRIRSKMDKCIHSMETYIYIYIIECMVLN